MASKATLKVHLDHLIYKESLRYVDPKPDSMGHDTFSRLGKDKLTELRFRDLDDTNEPYAKFPLFRKPDFQRETSAWSPQMCVDLLNSIFYGLVVPSLIVWKSPENNFIYILDGAHRVSVVRAWILDDWGDKAEAGYYERHEFATEITEAARQVRSLVKESIGSFEDVKTAGKKYLDISRRGGSPKHDMSETEFQRGLFYTDVVDNAGFHVQQVPGAYDTAETSFIRINQSGQRLETWEITLIENRNSSLARSIMSVANGGAGRYWPETTMDAVSLQYRSDLHDRSKYLHDLLFVPPLRTPIKDANVPFLASTKFFPKHAYLMELLPIIAESTLGTNSKDPDTLFASDRDATAEIIIKNGHRLIGRAQLVFQHLSGASNDPLSLSIVPLFYFYTRVGRYVRSSLYSFISWLMDGSEEDIRTRKIIFSAHRGRFERVLFENNVLGAITDKAGSGMRAIASNVEFNQKLMELLIEDISPPDSESFKKKFDMIIKNLTVQRVGGRTKTQRQYDDAQKTTINLREMFKSAIRCDICGGILDLSMGVQYDHILGYAETRITDESTGRPAHPFCNNARMAIEGYRNNQSKLVLPTMHASLFDLSDDKLQPSLFSLVNRTRFPDEDELE